VIKLAGSTGERLWTQSAGRQSSFASAPSVSIAPSGSVLLTGDSKDDLEGEGDTYNAYAMELAAADGAPLWLEQWGPSTEEDGRSIAMDSDDNVWVCGQGSGSSFVTKIVR